MYRNISLGMLGGVAVGIGLYFACDTNPGPVGIVVPHHDMVASARQAYLEQVRAQVHPKTIVVLSPDHFNQSNVPIVTTEQTWETILGDINADTLLIGALELPQNDVIFQSEHGLTVLLKDLKQYFSDAKIVPVMLSRNATYAEIATFIEKLNTACADCLVIASVDFSHTNTANVANLHDDLALRELAQADSVSLYKHAEADSPEALTALAMWAQLHNTKKFTVFSHTNSGYLTDTPVGEMTTHIIGGYQRGKEDATYDNVVTLMLGGDVMFARSVYEQSTQSATSPFQLLGDRFFWGVDVALVNLEGVFSESAQFQKAWNDVPPKLRFAPSTVGFLKMARITVAGMANNHTFDGGETEAHFSKTLLEQQGVSVVGYPRTSPGVLIKEEGNTKVAVIAVATHEPVSDIAESVQAYSERGYSVVAYIHWGDEYASTHTSAQEQMAQRLIDAGASLVVGSHPHVVQDVGVYKGVPIVYSLGNFLFDQNFRPETQVGAVLGVKISPEAVELFLVPVGSFEKSSVLPAPQYQSYINEWTKGWSDYRQDFDRFVFPIK